MSVRSKHHSAGIHARQPARLALGCALFGLAFAGSCTARPWAGFGAGSPAARGSSGDAGDAGAGGVRQSEGDRDAAGDDQTSYRGQAGQRGIESGEAGDAGSAAMSTGGRTERGRSTGAEAGNRDTVGNDAGGAGRVGVNGLPPPFTTVACGETDGAGGADDGGGDCTLSGTGAELVLRGTVLTPGVVYEDGAVRIDAAGVIACVGCGCADAGARVVRCSDAVISPGFVNPHDHVAYAEEAPRPMTSERYDNRHDWRLGLRGHAAIHYEGGASPLLRAAQELRMLLGGATAVAGGAGHAGLIRNPDMPDLMEGLPTAPADSETFPLDDADGRLLASGCAYGSHHADADSVARAGEFLGHFAEGVDRAAQNELDCALTADFGLIQPTTAVVHAVAVSATEAAALGARHAVVVWSPRSNLALYGNTAPVPLLLRSGVEVALGTDWLLTGSMNLLRELDCARSFAGTYLDGALDDHTLWSMVTTAAAHAVGAGSALGRLAPGYLGDVSVVKRHARAPYTAAVSANSADFELIVRGGRPLYGREALLTALSDSACEPLSVCGAAQGLCGEDSGFSLAELEAAAADSYPLFSCETPPNEPSCVPARPLEYDGALTVADRDGDGIPNESDLCPDTFDPIRPLDGTAEGDTDGDGIGDACDPCPLDSTQGCRDARSGDRDGDGIPDGTDDCADDADPEQRDADGDGHGDACDFCPRANPGIFPCPINVSAIRTPGAASRPPRHARLELGGIVTALRPDTGSARGFYLEDGGAGFSGLFVYTGSETAGLDLGDTVTVNGLFDEYYGVDQLVLGALVERTAGTAPTALDVNAAAIGDGGALAAAYDSMLVRVTDARVATTNPDAPADYDETGLDGALRLDDQLWPELDNDFAVNTRFSAVTGVLGSSFEHRKLWPRTAADFEP